MNSVSVGDVFGRLTVISEKFFNESRGRYYVTVKCLCGTVKDINCCSLTKTKSPTRSCGCLTREKATKIFSENVIGKKFNKLTPVSDLGIIAVGNKGFKSRVFRCLCDCGNSIDVRYDHLISGNSKSCGCLQRLSAIELSTKHGLSKTPTYLCWAAMKQRCHNPKNTLYPLYGERGISYDPNWESFENFLADMGECPEGLTLDRIDVNGNYCKENCRWENCTVQMHNRRKQKSKNRVLTSVFKGVSYDKRRGAWICKLNYKYENVFVKRFKTELEAAIAYDQQSLIYYGDEPNKEIIKEYKENG